jgi:hypothetical protein
MVKRALTPNERQLAQSMFRESIDLDRVAINNHSWWPFQPRNILMAPDGEIWCHPRGGTWREDFACTPVHSQALFIHEMTHVWQAQRGGRWYLPLMRHPFCRYDYRIEPGKPFHRYGIEQQAEIVCHAFLLRNGVKLPDQPPLEIYEALLPFGTT